MKVLVVDDHALIRDALRRVLEGLEREVTVYEAGDCAQAFRVMEAQPQLDLVLLDLNLPGMRGLDALMELRTRHPAVAVVVVSAAEDRASVTQALDHGAMGYITKSSSNEVLAALCVSCFPAASTFRRKFSRVPSHRCSPAIFCLPISV